MQEPSNWLKRAQSCKHHRLMTRIDIVAESVRAYRRWAATAGEPDERLLISRLPEDVHIERTLGAIPPDVSGADLAGWPKAFLAWAHVDYGTDQEVSSRNRPTVVRTSSAQVFAEIDGKLMVLSGQRNDPRYPKDQILVEAFPAGFCRQPVPCRVLCRVRAKRQIC